jgi:pimeloyl-ACP methyl ester carboxylesterase
LTPAPGAIEVHGLRLACLRWDPVPAGAAAEDTIFLLHGFLDVAWSMAALAEALRREGVGATLFAPDWRGHGDSGWVGAGGYYYFMDYVLDLAELVERLGRGRTFLVGHSMGGGAASLYAGTFPDRVAGLVNIEGLGPPAEGPADGPPRVRAWTESVRRRLSMRESPRGYASIEEAAERLRKGSPGLSPEAARALAERATRDNAQGERVWKFDPLHRTPSPLPFRLDQAMAFWRSITAPVLVVEGERSPWRALADREDRLACFGRSERIVIPGAGHMVHHDAPGELAAAVAAFLRSIGP